MKTLNSECECCGENEGRSRPGLYGAILCDECAGETSCSGESCQHILSAANRDFDPDAPPPVDGWLCDECRAALEESRTVDSVADALRDIGWELVGASEKSEALYYSHPDRAKRIRVAHHDSPYEPSLECIYICAGHDVTPEADVHLRPMADLTEIVQAISKAHELAGPESPDVDTED